MTTFDELVEAMRHGACRYSPDSHPKEWPLCASGKLKHPECAVAAMLRALPESDEAVTAIYYALEYGGERRDNAERVAAALARLADEVTP